MHIDDKIINFYLNKNYCNFLIKIIAMNTPAYSEKNKTPFFSLYSFFLFLSVLICITGFLSCDIKRENEEEEEPDVNYFALRNEHYGTVPQEIKNAIEARLALDDRQQETNAIASVTSPWQLIGPANTGGRITDIEMPRNNDTIIYAGSASGGIFVSTNFGTSWTPVFDKQTSLAIGDIGAGCVKFVRFVRSNPHLVL